MDTLLIGIASCSLLAGIGVIYFAWRQGRRFWPGLIAGWGLVLLSGGFWILATGVEFGSALVLFCLPLAAWLPLIPQWQSPAHIHYPRVQKAEAKPRVWAIAGRVILLLVFAAISSTLVAVVLVQFLPLSHLARLVWALLLQIVLWGLLAVWLCGAARLRVPLICSSVSALVAALSLFVLAQ